MLPELSGARSVAPQGQPFGAMSCLGVAFLEKSLDVPSNSDWKVVLRLALAQCGKACLTGERS
jgi:hypothetical protein